MKTSKAPKLANSSKSMRMLLPKKRQLLKKKKPPLKVTLKLRTLRRKKVLQ